MDDILEIIIYLAFILLSAGGGIYKSYTKKKEEEAKRQRRNQSAAEMYTHEEEPKIITQEIPKRPSTLEEFLQQQFEIEQTPDPEIEEVVLESTNIEASKDNLKEGEAVFESTIDDLISDNMNEPDFSITDSLTEQDFYKQEDEENNSDEDELGFDLRQAVINSEILNRKY